MDSLSAKAFFSQVYDPRIQNTRDWIKRTASALDVETFHLSNASSNTPREEAKRLISRSDFVIALCTKKIKKEGEESWLTSPSVIEEIATARSLEKPVLCFFENGVEASGFIPSTATYSTLENAENLTANDMENIIRSIHAAKLQSVNPSEDVSYHTAIRNFTIRELEILIELVDGPNGFYWEYTIERKVDFHENHSLPLLSAAFCLEHREGCGTPPKWAIEIERNGAPTDVSHTVKNGFGSVEIRTTVEPDFVSGDSIFLRERYRSPTLVPIIKDHCESPILEFNGRKFDACDGMSIISRVEKITIRLAFPRGYESVNPEIAVYTFSNNLDHIHQSEIDRLNSISALQKRLFDKRQHFEFSIDRPLYQYFYGLAWNVPSSIPDGKIIASDCDDF